MELTLEKLLLRHNTLLKEQLVDVILIRCTVKISLLPRLIF